jgi:hypothetical protein
MPPSTTPPGYPPPGFSPPGAPPLGFPPGGPPRGPLPAPKKKGSSGCLIALAIVGGLLILIVGIAAYGVYRVSQSPEGRKVFGAIREVQRTAVDAATAPGTAELRRLGCQQAMVMDLNNMVKLFAGDAGLPAGTEEGPMLLVNCQLGLLAKSIPCGEVARTYVAAVGSAKGPFQVHVTAPAKGPQCVECFDQTGQPMSCKGRTRGARPRARPTAPAADPGDGP